MQFTFPTRCRISIMILLVTPATSMLRADEKPSGTWPQFRGQNASGVAEGSPLAAKWDATKGENILWKAATPGLGFSSPVIWGDQIFLTTAVSEGDKQASLKVGLYGDITPVSDDTPQSFRVLSLDKNTGKIRWEKEAHKGVPKIKRHTKASHANCSPATDGKHVVAFFGSEGLYCYDMNGELRWKQDLGVLDAGYYVVPAAQWGFASSPVIYGDKVYLQCDVQKDSFVAALNLSDGSFAWKTPRDEVPTWSTPAIIAGAPRPQMVVNGYKRIAGYDLSTGKEIWWMKGGGDIPVPTPIVANDLVYITNAHGALAPIYAIRLTAEGDISLSADETSNSHIAWAHLRTGNYMQSPLIYKGLLYACRDSGILACYDAKTGQKIFRERLADGVGFTASPVAGDEKIYFTSEEGDVYVVKAGEKFEIVSQNPLGDISMATPAISDGVLFFRTRNQLIAVGRKE